MGADIHAGFQKRVKDAEGNESWEFIPDHKYQGNRHYFLFGWLANVRNGYGFAGCDTGDAIRPLAKPRGLPEGLVPLAEPVTEWQYDAPEWRQFYHNGGDDFGDHSHSWLTSTEILEGSKNFSSVNKRGIISIAEYVAWDKKTPLKYWSGGIWGKGHRTVDQPELSGQMIRGQLYGDALNKELERGRNKIQRKLRYTKQMVATDHNPKFEVSTFDGIFGRCEPVEKVEKLVRIRIPTRKKSALKHQAKLNRYSQRLGGTLSVRVQWTLDQEAIHKEFAYFTDEVKRLHGLYGEVRMVFGFDS